MQNSIALTRYFAITLFVLTTTTAAFGQTYPPAIEHESLLCSLTARRSPPAEDQLFPTRSIGISTSGTSYMPTLPKNRWLTMADIVKSNGEIASVVKANGQPVKTYKTQVAGGQLQRLEQNRVGFEPRTSFISPRYVDTTDR